MANGFLWQSSFLLTYTFPLLKNTLNAYETFWLNVINSFAGFLIILKKLQKKKKKS